MLLIYLDERESDARSDAEIKVRMDAHVPYIEMLRKNGRYAGSDALGPARSARTLRSAGGKPLATEGPFAESREQFGGFYVVEAKDLDDAIDAASRCPALKTTGVFGIEIRPIPEAFGRADPAPASPDHASQSRYLLAIYRDETTPEALNDEAQRAALLKWGPYLERLRGCGQLVAAEPLAASGSATSVRFRDGAIVLTDGPFVAREAQLAGYCVVWARNMEEAVSLASECPDAQQHAIEVRPIRGAPRAPAGEG